MRALSVVFCLILASPVYGRAIDLSSGHDGAFYSKLRFDYAAQKDFSPSWTADDHRKAIETAFHNGDIEKTIKLGRAWLERVPVDSEVYLMIAMCMKEKGDLKAYCQYPSPFYGLLQSITATGTAKRLRRHSR
jgi:hypothetical protein